MTCGVASGPRMGPRAVAISGGVGWGSRGFGRGPAIAGTSSCDGPNGSVLARPCPTDVAVERGGAKSTGPNGSVPSRVCVSCWSESAVDLGFTGATAGGCAIPAELSVCERSGPDLCCSRVPAATRTMGLRGCISGCAGFAAGRSDSAAASAASASPLGPKPDNVLGGSVASSATGAVASGTTTECSPKDTRGSESSGDCGVGPRPTPVVRRSRFAKSRVVGTGCDTGPSGGTTLILGAGPATVELVADVAGVAGAAKSPASVVCSRLSPVSGAAVRASRGSGTSAVLAKDWPESETGLI